MRVGEPSSDSGIRGLSTNFAFLRGAKDKKRERERQREGGGEKQREIEFFPRHRITAGIGTIFHP